MRRQLDVDVHELVSRELYDFLLLLPKGLREPLLVRVIGSEVRDRATTGNAMTNERAPVEDGVGDASLHERLTPFVATKDALVVPESRYRRPQACRAHRGTLGGWSEPADEECPTAIFHFTWE